MEEFSDTNRKSKGFTSETEKEVFEIQLVQLQEQLESAMIEKEQMGTVLVNSAQMNTLNFHKTCAISDIDIMNCIAIVSVLYCTLFNNVLFIFKFILYVLLFKH